MDVRDMKCSKCGMTGHNKRTCMPRAISRKKKAAVFTSIAKTPNAKGKVKKNANLTVEDRIVKIHVVGSDATPSKVECTVRGLTEWVFTDGKVVWTRTNPKHTRGLYRTG